MSLINLEEVSGTIYIQNRAFSAKEILQAVIKEAVPVELREGALAIGIERIFPQSTSNAWKHPDSPGREYSLLIHEIARIKREVMQINNVLQLNNREIDPRRTPEEMRLRQYLKQETSDSRTAYRNSEHNRSTVPPVPFPEGERETLFDFFKDSDNGDSREGFLRSQIKCKQCGHILPEAAKYCNACGTLTIDSSRRIERENSASGSKRLRRSF